MNIDTNAHVEELSAFAPVFEAGRKALMAESALEALKVSELGILLVLGKLKPGRWSLLGDLRGSSSLTTSSFSRAIKKLTELGYIAQRSGEDDKRNKQVRLTNKGRQLLKPFAKSLSALAQEPSPVQALPLTTKKRYLTGRAALNIPSEEGTGDWHFFEVFQGSHGRSPGPFPIAGKDLPDTAPWWGDYGIENRADAIRRAGVEVQHAIFAANHRRAMLDMIYQRLKDGSGLGAYDVKDWFPSAADRHELKTLLGKIQPALDTKQADELASWMEAQDVA